MVENLEGNLPSGNKQYLDLWLPMLGGRSAFLPNQTMVLCVSEMVWTKLRVQL
jgi:hypothetical protein